MTVLTKTTYNQNVDEHFENNMCNYNVDEHFAKTNM